MAYDDDNDNDDVADKGYPFPFQKCVLHVIFNVLCAVSISPFFIVAVAFHSYIVRIVYTFFAHKIVVVCSHVQHCFHIVWIDTTYDVSFFQMGSIQY